ncbi:MAG: NAD(P)H-hydrate dehydratase [Campylobacterota bacterium]|nr:NAD(P)H-hydrate dehydratase [Campylobacterota bacterium]
MQKLFDEVGTLDKRCYEDFGLSEDILMEHAAGGMADYIRANFVKKSKIIIACGSGNNGADGIALARMLHGEYDVKLFYVKHPKSKMAILQAKRSRRVGVTECSELSECDVLVDAVVGTGFVGEFYEGLKESMQKLNALTAFKIACDIPSGLDANGNCAKESFVADISLTMGALKRSMFLDEAKEFVGEIRVLDLGVSRELYETQSNWNLLEMKDMKLPLRDRKNTHKGSFGHLAVISGEKVGASIISGLSALRFGSGLVTLVGYENEQVLSIPYELMYGHKIPKNATALAIGMGLGFEFSDGELQEFLERDLALVVDADIFHMSIVLDILKKDRVVLTPHPKEFVALLKLTEIVDIDVAELQANRFKYVEAFCSRYPNAVVLLKGANVIIAKDKQFFINPHGSSVLAKGGSGDVLSGLIGALLAQGYEPLNAAISASLAHTKLAEEYQGSNFSMTPKDLIDSISQCSFSQ